MSNSENDLLTLGWREWVSLPTLGLNRIKAKVDTGARTSSLHAFEVRDFEVDGIRRVEFKMHPNQRDNETQVICVADIIDERSVRDSGGRAEDRWVIAAPVTIGTATWNIEINLTSRDNMGFRMLLGRTAFRGLAVVDPARSYVLGKRHKRKRKKK